MGYQLLSHFIQHSDLRSFIPALTMAHRLLATSLSSPIGPVAERARVPTGSLSASGIELSLWSLRTPAMVCTEHRTYLRI